MDKEDKNVVQLAGWVDRETERLLVELLEQVRNGKVDGVEVVVFYRRGGHSLRWAGRALRDAARALGGATDLVATIFNKIKN